MTYVYITLGYLGVGTFLVFFYIGAAGYFHCFSWKTLWRILSEKENIPPTLILIVLWFPVIVFALLKGLVDRFKDR